MTDNTQKANDNLGIKHIHLKSSDEVFSLRLLPANKARIAFAKATSLLAPVMSVAYDTYNEYKSTQIEDEEGNVQSTGEIVSFFEFSVILGQQVEKPEFQELLDILLEDLKVAGQDFDFNEHFRGRLDDQMKIIEVAFKENLLVPLVRWLKDRGFAEILTYLQPMVEIKQELQKDW